MSSSGRQYTIMDQLLLSIDQGLRNLFGSSAEVRPNPADQHQKISLDTKQRAKVAGLMRVNHAGEVCAQALYQGQALTARNVELRRKFIRSAQEESDHLAWCEQRLKELDSHTSYLNPCWYLGSLWIGIMAGLAGDRLSLGFVAETERQVLRHLQRHLQRLPSEDAKSRQILLQMCQDEAQHETAAREAGAADLPKPVQLMMSFASKIMTTIAYWI